MSSLNIAKLIGAAFIIGSLSVSLTARGGSHDSALLMQDGINAYQNGQFDQAHEKFSQLLGDSRWSFAALYNLGNVATRQKKMGEALGYYRRALQKKPMDPDTRSNMAFVLSTLGIRQFPGARGTWELFSEEILNSVTINQVLTGMLIVSFFFLFNLYKYLRRRKLARFEDEPVPIQPPFIFFIWAVLLLFFMVTSIGKTVDGYNERATVVITKTDLKSGPGEANASLADLGEGYEVLIQDRSGGWRQVTALDGQRVGLTGWVKADALMPTSGRGPW